MRKVKNYGRWILVVVLCGMVNSGAKEKPPLQFEEQRQAEATAKKEAAESAKAQKTEPTEIERARARLPEDTTARLMVKEIRFQGNTLVTTKSLIANMPVIFNASNKPLGKAGSEYLYDFTAVREILSMPGTAREVSARTIQGLTQYVLSVYQKKNYGGIYVYVPAETLKGAELKDGVLQIDIIEARVSSVGTKYYDTDQNAVEKGRLNRNAMLWWSPAQSGAVINRKKLDDFVNLLNLNPDRYVSATVSKGTEANTLAVNYGIYEARPWHYFIQVDNSGAKNSQWNPRIGVINTNLLGFDDSLFVMYQFKPDSGWQDNYSLFGSYDFPLLGPKLRLNIYGGYSEFDISPQATNIDFIGGGKFIGADLRYNVFQTDGWFFDVIGSLSHEESRITPSIFSEFLKSDVRMDLWGFAVDIHKRDDVSNTSLGYKFTACMGGSGEDEFRKARADSERSFAIHNFNGMYSRLLDPNKVTRLSTTIKWVFTDDRLPPAKMTPFGGMYSVRGYKEYEIIGDGGVLASAQYEFDIIRYEKLRRASRQDVDKEQKKEKGLKKLAPLAFMDFGRSMINDPRGTEEGHHTLLSIGIGAIAEYGDNLSGGVYYGIPLRKTEETDAGKGRVNASIMLRW